MATFGYETEGSSQKVMSGAFQYGGGHTYSPAQNGTLDSITAYLVQNGAYLPHLRFGLYDSSDDSLVGETEEWQLTTGWDGWKTLNVSGSPAIFSAKSYYFAIGEAHQLDLKHNSGSQGYKYESVGWAQGSNFENPWVGYTTSGSQFLFSWYGTYTPSGAGLSIPVAMHHYGHHISKIIRG